MQEFKINDKVRTNSEYLSWKGIFRLSPFNKGIITDIYMIEYHTIAKVKVNRKIRDINVRFLELCL
jgi:hypothetical protein